MLSVFTDILAEFLKWIGWVCWDMFEYVSVDHHLGVLAQFIALGIAASIIAFSVKILHRVSSHGR